MPIITDKIPGPCTNLRAGDIMSSNPIKLKYLSTMEEIRKAIEDNNHHAFPLVNDEDRLVGIIPRNFIIVIIKEKAFYRVGPRERSNS